MIIVKNSFLIACKFVFLVFFYLLLIFVIAGLFSNVDDKVSLLTIEIIQILPYLFFSVISFFLFFLYMSSKESIEFLPVDDHSIPETVNIWNVQENKILPSSTYEPTTGPIVKMNLLLPANRFGKRGSLLTVVPLAALRSQNFLSRFLSLRRVQIPLELKDVRTVLIPFGGLVNKDSGTTGDLLLSVEPLTGSQAFQAKLVQYLVIFVPVIFFILYVYYFIL